MQRLKNNRSKDVVGSTVSVIITLDQTIFKRELMHVFTDRFVTSQSIKKRVCITQCKRFPKPNKAIPFGVTFLLDGADICFFILLGQHYTACLKLMGCYCFLKTKKGKKSLMESVKLTMDEVDHVDEVQINGVHFDYKYFRSILHLDDFAFNVERCKNISEFLVLTKKDFEQEQYIKTRLYGKEFENMDCPNLVKNYLRGVMLSHTFNDDFTFVDFNSTCIPCSWMHSEKRRSLNKVVSQCEMAKMHLVMMSFVHNQIEHVSPFNRLGDFDIHEHIGSRVFFHDRLLERWMCDIYLDMVSESFSKKSSNTKECKDFVKRNIFIIFDKIT